MVIELRYERRVSRLRQPRAVRVFGGNGQTKYAAAPPTARDTQGDFSGLRKVPPPDAVQWRGFAPESQALCAGRTDISVEERIPAQCLDRSASFASRTDASHFVCSRQAGCCMDQKMRRAAASSGMSRRSEAGRWLSRAAYKHECMRRHRESTIWQRTSQCLSPDTK